MHIACECVCVCCTSKYAELLYNDNPLSERSVYLSNVVPIFYSLALSFSFVYTQWKCLSWLDVFFILLLSNFSLCLPFVYLNEPIRVNKMQLKRTLQIGVLFSTLDEIKSAIVFA